MSDPFEQVYTRCLYKQITDTAYPTRCRIAMDFDNNISKTITILPKHIDAMLNIKVDSSDPNYVGDIYNGNKVIATFRNGEAVPDIYISMYIETKIVITSLKIPHVCKITYDATLLSNDERLERESKIVYATSWPINDLIADGKGISYYRACANMSRAANLGEYDNPNKVLITHIEKCHTCARNILFNAVPIWYVNSPDIEYLLCDTCGREYGEKGGDDDIIHCYKFTMWSCS